jgi:hypothetical protein
MFVSALMVNTTSMQGHSIAAMIPVQTFMSVDLSRSVIAPMQKAMNVATP